MDKEEYILLKFGNCPQEYFDYKMMVGYTQWWCNENIEYNDELIKTDLSKSGDRQSTIAFKLAKLAKKPPKQIAEEIVSLMPVAENEYHKIYAENGFINLIYKPALLHIFLRAIL